MNNSNLNSNFEDNLKISIIEPNNKDESLLIKNISILDAKTAYENEKNIESNYINCNVRTEIKNIAIFYI